MVWLDRKNELQLNMSGECLEFSFKPKSCLEVVGED